MRSAAPIVALALTLVLTAPATATLVRAFFGIWLDPRTSRPEYRKRLLGETD
jgi:hypothetical protein